MLMPMILTTHMTAPAWVALIVALREAARYRACLWCQSQMKMMRTTLWCRYRRAAWASMQHITPPPPPPLNKQHTASTPINGGERQGASRRPPKFQRGYGDIFGANEASIDEYRRIVAMPIMLLNSTGRRPARV